VSTKAVMDTTGTGRRRNRSWPEALKREIVAASYAPGSSVSIVARRYDVNTNQVFGWRKLYRDGSSASADPTGPVLLPVTVTAESGDDVAAESSAADTIEIELAGNIVFVSAAVSTARHCGGCSTCWSGDDPDALGCPGLAGGRPDRHASGHERFSASGPIRGQHSTPIDRLTGTRVMDRSKHPVRCGRFETNGGP
jgi:transposase